MHIYHIIEALFQWKACFLRLRLQLFFGIIASIEHFSKKAFLKQRLLLLHRILQLLHLRQKAVKAAPELKLLFLNRPALHNPLLQGKKFLNHPFSLMPVSQTDNHSDKNRDKTERHRDITHRPNLICKNALRHDCNDLPAITGKTGTAGHKAAFLPSALFQISFPISIFFSIKHPVTAISSF